MRPSYATNHAPSTRPPAPDAPNARREYGGGVRTPLKSPEGAVILSCRAERSAVETSGCVCYVAAFAKGPFGRNYSESSREVVNASGNHGRFAARSLHSGLRPPVEMTEGESRAPGRDDRGESCIPARHLFSVRTGPRMPGWHAQAQLERVFLGRGTHRNDHGQTNLTVPPSQRNVLVVHGCGNSQGSL